LIYEHQLALKVATAKGHRGTPKRVEEKRDHGVGIKYDKAGLGKQKQLPYGPAKQPPKVPAQSVTLDDFKRMIAGYVAAKEAVAG